MWTHTDLVLQTLLLLLAFPPPAIRAAAAIPPRPSTPLLSIAIGSTASAAYIQVPPSFLGLSNEPLNMSASILPTPQYQGLIRLLSSFDTGPLIIRWGGNNQVRKHHAQTLTPCTDADVFHAPLLAPPPCMSPPACRPHACCPPMHAPPHVHSRHRPLQDLPPCMPAPMPAPMHAPPHARPGTPQDQVTAPLSDDQWRSMADLHNATGVRYILGLNLVVRGEGRGRGQGGLQEAAQRDGYVLSHEPQTHGAGAGGCGCMQMLYHEAATSSPTAPPATSSGT